MLLFFPLSLSLLHPFLFKFNGNYIKGAYLHIYFCAYALKLSEEHDTLNDRKSWTIRRQQEGKHSASEKLTPIYTFIVNNVLTYALSMHLRAFR